MAETRPEWYYCPDCGLPLNYEPNTRHWQRGAVVIHDKDEKSARMLMEVQGYTPEGFVETQYINKEWRQKWIQSSQGKLINPLCALHDPKRFGIEIPAERQRG